MRRMTDSEARKASYLPASSLTFFLSFFRAFMSSTLMDGMPAAALSQSIWSPRTQMDSERLHSLGRAMEPAKRLSLEG